MKHTEEKYYELQTKPVIAATGGASLGSLFGATGILIGGLFCSILWLKTKDDVAQVIAKIKSRSS